MANARPRSRKPQRREYVGALHYVNPAGDPDVVARAAKFLDDPERWMATEHGLMAGDGDHGWTVNVGAWIVWPAEGGVAIVVPHAEFVASWAPVAEAHTREAS